MLNRFLRFFAVGAHLRAGSADGVEVFVKSTVTLDHVEYGSIAHLVLHLIAVKFVDNDYRKLIGSYG